MEAKYFKITRISEAEYIRQCGEGLECEQEVNYSKIPDAIYVGIDVSEAYEMEVDIEDLDRLDEEV